MSTSHLKCTGLRIERAPKLSDHLPYESYSPETRLFRQKDGSLGVVFEAIPAIPEPMTVEQLALTVDYLRSWFTLPSNCVLQILYDQSPTSFFAKRILVSIRFFPRPDEEQDDSRRFSEIIANFDHSSRVPLRRLKADEFINILRLFFQPNSFSWRESPLLERGVSLSEQVGLYAPLDRAGLRRDGVTARALVLETMPQFVFPGGLAFFLRLPFPLKLSLSFEFFEGSHHVQLLFVVIVENPNEEALELMVQRTIQALHEDFACAAVVEVERGFELCLGSLPLNHGGNRGRVIGARLRLLGAEATSFTPLFSFVREWHDPLGMALTPQVSGAQFH